MNRNAISLLGATVLLLAPLSATAHESRQDHDDERDRTEDRAGRHPQRPEHHGHNHGEHEEHQRDGWSRQLEAGGGWFSPWQGRGGHQEQFAFLSTSPSGHFRFGAEFVHRKFKSRIFNVEHVDIHSYQGNVVVHGVLNPGHLTPYVGVGIGLHANDFSKHDIQRGNPALDVRDDVGLGYGIFAILGLEVPIGHRLSLYGEGRLNLAYQVVGFDRSAGHAYADFHHDRVDRVQSEDLGGGSAVFGARLRF